MAFCAFHICVLASYSYILILLAYIAIDVFVFLLSLIYSTEYTPIYV